MNTYANLLQQTQTKYHEALGEFLRRKKNGQWEAIQDCSRTFNKTK